MNMAEQLTKKEKLALKREEKNDDKKIEQKQEKQKKMLVWIGSIVGVIALLALIIYYADTTAGETPGTAMTNQGREHVQAGQDHEEYNSTPPTSGPHASTGAWGVHKTPVPYENQIHNLEHGGVIIHYNPDTIQNLEELEDLFDSSERRYPKTVLTPDESLDTVYALTAWTRLDTFDVYDEERIKNFVKKLYNTGPEPNAS